MRKPRDFDAELQALTDKAKALKSKKQGQLGELVIATGADALSIEQLAGALLEAIGADAARKEAWRKSGAAFFRMGGARARKGAGRNAGGAAAAGTSPKEKLHPKKPCFRPISRGTSCDWLHSLATVSGITDQPQ
jgi:hypothetical protein